MNTRNVLTAALAFLMATSLWAFAEKQEAPKKQTTCPVMGGKINPAQYVDVNGKRIYVCCAGCTGPIKADPAKYIKKMEAEGIEIEKTPEKR